MSTRAKKIRLTIGVIAAVWAIVLILFSNPLLMTQLPIFMLYLLIVLVSTSILFSIGEALLCEESFVISRVTANIASIVLVLCFIFSFPLKSILEIL